MATATDRLLGKSIKRREDPRFITGRGNYVDDLKLPGMTYAAFVRSPHAHARIKTIDVAAAKAAGSIRTEVAIFFPSFSSQRTATRSPTLSVSPWTRVASVRTSVVSLPLAARTTKVLATRSTRVTVPESALP